MDQNEQKREAVEVPFFQQIADRSLQYLLAGYPVHFTGPSGVGKTTLALQVAELLGRPVTILRGYYRMGNEDLLGRYVGYHNKKIVDNYLHNVLVKEEWVKPVWSNSRLVEAVRNGHTVVYDEFTRSSPEINNLFLSVLEEKILPLYGSHHKEPFVRVHPQFSMIFTSNPTEYAGVYQTQDALLDRMITLNLDYCDRETEASIVVLKTGISRSDAKIIVSMTAAVRDYCSGRSRQVPSLRASLMIASISQHMQIPVDPEDERFLSLCADVLWLPLSSTMGSGSTVEILQCLSETIGNEKEEEDG